MEPVYPDPEPDPEPDPAPEPDPTPEPAPLKPMPVPTLIKGTGTEEDPYVYLWNDSCWYTEDFIAAVLPMEAEEPTHTEEPSEPQDPGETENPEEPGETDEPAEPTEPTEPEQPENPDEPSDGENKPDDTPTVYKTKTVYAVFAKYAYDNTQGNLEQFWGLIFTRNSDGSYKFSYFLPDASVLQSEDDSTDESDDGNLDDFGNDNSDDYDDMGYDDPFSYEDTSSGYTTEEIAQLRSQSQQRIKDLTTNVKVDEIKYKKMQLEMSNDVVKAALDGVIKSVATEEEAQGSSTPIILLSSGGGYFVTGTMGEFALDTVQLGQEVTVMSYMTGESATGKIVEISTQPTTNGWMWSDGNRNVSYYPFKVYLSDEANFQENDYVEITYSADGGTQSVYLEMPFVLSENGKSYVYLQGGNELLEKREVVTGRNLWGSYIEIKSGVTTADYVAFPYGKDVFDGAPTRQADINELYESMY